MNTETEYFIITAAGREMFVKVTLKNRAVQKVNLSLDPASDAASYHHGSQPELARKLQDILDGKRDSGSLFSDISGTGYQLKVWEHTSKIPYGATITYGELSERVGKGSPRSAGQALRANPVPIIIPCHRVLAAGGRLGGFSSGTEIKQLLLRHEYEISSGK